MAFRSDVGARLATAAGVDVVAALLADERLLAEPSRCRRLLEDDLLHRIVHSWRRSVDAHLQSTPWSETELSTLRQQRGPEGCRRIEQDKATAYGATLLVVFITEAYLACLQLGDGDILVVSSAGTVSRPIPPDERMIANETLSLCSNEAWGEFRVTFQHIGSDPPALVLVSTDGYSNAYRDDAAFQKVGVDILAFLRRDGIEAVSRDLPEWLRIASKSGSGDDITLVLLCRLDALGEDSELLT